ncbi:glycosyltransferase family 9 protein [Desulfocurvus sp.]|jgi:ADP-heptose:LPS heptosyltransferase|uniref:glycosyltransferase family 9 protein n=1 Tax=Desulfocurvus sp. TaxID=2871698 RepID=UPI0025BAF2D7|nr:glycosyltransferase family 9 protein [Desulfocurvus sp.]MCK9240106.1 glycosyltransferase family 9 protein [Desulfocurvus sp.]
MTHEARGPVLAVLVAGIGDLVLGRDALRALRAGLPGREMHLVVNAQALPLARVMALADGLHGFPIRELRSGPGALGRALGAVAGLRRLGPALAVNLYPPASRAGALRMGLLLRATGAPGRVGVAALGLGPWLTRGVAPAELAGLHAARVMERVALAAGGVPAGPAGPVDLALAGGCRHDALLGGGGPLVGLNPGTDQPGKRWAPGAFAAVADALAREFGARAVILGGPGEEAAGRAVAGAMTSRAAVLTGRMTLAELGHVLTRLDLLVTTDSGPMHMAAAAGVPLVAVFRGSDPARFGPLGVPGRCRTLACAPGGDVSARAVIAASRDILLAGRAE